VGDLVQQVLAAIDRAERKAGDVHDERCDYLPEYECWHTGTWPCDCGEPDRIRRRCTADRRIVQQHQPDRSAPEELVCGVCIEPGYIGVEHSID
jgi:hypothetical protein